MNSSHWASTPSHRCSKTSFLILTSSSSSVAERAGTVTALNATTATTHFILPPGLRTLRLTARQLGAQQLHPDEDLPLLHHVAQCLQFRVLRAISQRRDLQKEAPQLAAHVLRA